MRLNFGGNLTGAMSVCNRRCGVIRCSLQLSGTSSLDLVAKNGYLAIGNGRDAGRGRTALLGSRLDSDPGEACALQLATNQHLVMVAMRRADQKARRIGRKDPR